ncbi:MULTISPECIES: hypothetical protein [unclassified Clostridium]|uniref:hypothetical protein n=1 Tax=unclassified Clostridium TaxID=2614128 RepID=UPI00207AB1B5|nr:MULTISPECIES: hypothetical protein [unclassified Clostridium]
MKLTSNYSLKKPDGSDVVNVQDFNDNSDKIDLELKKVDSSLKDIANDSYPIVEATGTNVYVGSTDKITKLSKGTRCTLFVGNNATGNCNLNLNNYGAKNIKDSFGNIVNNIKANIPYNLCYNGSDFILQGKGGGGNATADKLLSGSTATVDRGLIVGTMQNQGTKTATLNCGGSYIIPAGYHNGSGKVTVNSLVSQTPGNAAAAQILSGFSAWVNGNKINGSATLKNLGGYTIKELTVDSYQKANTVPHNKHDDVYNYVYIPNDFNSGFIFVLDDRTAYTYILNYNGINYKTYIRESYGKKGYDSNFISTNGRWDGNRMYLYCGEGSNYGTYDNKLLDKKYKMIVISNN